MNRSISRISHLLALAGLFIATIGFAQANTVSHLFGSYRVIQKANVGSVTRVRLQVQLTNRGGRDLRIERMTLWRSSHPGQGGTGSSPFVIRTGGSTSTTREFKIQRSEYRALTRGTPLTFLVTVKGPEGHEATEVVRLDPISRGKAN